MFAKDIATAPIIATGILTRYPRDLELEPLVRVTIDDHARDMVDEETIVTAVRRYDKMFASQAYNVWSEVSSLAIECD